MIGDIVYERAKNLDHALTLLAKAGPKPTLLAGGTDVMVWLESGRFQPERIVDIWGLRADLRDISIDDDEVRIGAMATYAELMRNAAVAERLPLLVEAAREVGAVQIQNRGTLGGNIGGSSPAGDTLPVLLAYDANVVLTSKKGGERVVPYAEFCTGYRETARAEHELITEVRFPVPPAGATQHWAKAGTRLAQAISKVMVAGVGAVDDKGTITHLRVAAGSVAAVPVVLDAVAKACVGKKWTPAIVEKARKAAEKDVSPIDDVRSTADYRRTVTGNMVARLLRAMRPTGLEVEPESKPSAPKKSAKKSTAKASASKKQSPKEEVTGVIEDPTAKAAETEKAPPKKAPTKKKPPKKAPPEKAPPKKAPPEKAPPKKAPPEKAPPKKAPPAREEPTKKTATKKKAGSDGDAT